MAVLKEHLPVITKEIAEPEERPYYSDYDIAAARALLALRPDLQEWALQEYNYGFVNLTNLRDPQQIEQLKATRHTSEHEGGHKIVALSRNWSVGQMSVIRQGNVLGYTVSTPPGGKTIEQLFLDKIAIAMGGWAAEEMDDHPHGGCASDFQMANMFAEALSDAKPEVYGTAQAIISRQQAWALQAVREYGEQNRTNEARRLQNAGIID